MQKIADFRLRKIKPATGKKNRGLKQEGQADLQAPGPVGPDRKDGQDHDDQ